MEGIGKGLILLLCFLAYSYPVFGKEASNTGVDWKDITLPLFGIIFTLVSVHFKSVQKRNDEKNATLQKGLDEKNETLQKGLNEEKAQREKLELKITEQRKEDREFLEKQFFNVSTAISGIKQDIKEEYKEMDQDLKTTNKQLAKLSENLTKFIAEYEAKAESIETLKVDVAHLKDHKSKIDIWKETVKGELEHLKQQVKP